MTIKRRDSDTDSAFGRGSRRALLGLVVFAAICAVIVAAMRGELDGAGATAANNPAANNAARNNEPSIPPQAEALVKRALRSMATTRRAIAALEFCRSYGRTQRSLQDAQASLDEMISKLRKSDGSSTKPHQKGVN